MLISLKLPRAVRRPLRVDDDGLKFLKPVNAALHGTRPLLGPDAPYAVPPQLVDDSRVLAVKTDVFIPAKLFCPSRKLVYIHSARVHLADGVQYPAFAVIRGANHDVRVDGVAKVPAVVKVIHPRDLFVRDAADDHVVKYRAAGARHLAHIHPAIAHRVGRLDLHRLFHKFLANPRDGHLQIRRVQHIAVVAPYERLLVYPTVHALRRVVAVKSYRVFQFAAKHRCLDGLYLIHVFKLSELFKPDVFEVAFFELDGLRFFRVVHAEEQNALARGLVDELAGRDAALEML